MEGKVQPFLHFAHCCCTVRPPHAATTWNKQTKNIGIKRKEKKNLTQHNRVLPKHVEKAVD